MYQSDVQRYIQRYTIYKDYVYKIKVLLFILLETHVSLLKTLSYVKKVYVIFLVSYL